ncbi:hypothetical protein SUGI_0826090 [Cryptomeria japonica]|nr:hypothetical protein SUGI_0826090 [Cryptomeria japonica]
MVCSRLMCTTFLLLLTTVVNQQQEDPCASSDGNGRCGLNAICMVGENSKAVCSCPPGFDSNPNSVGCYRNESTRLGCDGSKAEMQDIGHVDWMYNDYEHLTMVDKSSCKQACLDDCECTVAISLISPTPLTVGRRQCL